MVFSDYFERVGSSRDFSSEELGRSRERRLASSLPASALHTSSDTRNRREKRLNKGRNSPVPPLTMDFDASYKTMTTIVDNSSSSPSLRYIHQDSQEPSESDSPGSNLEDDDASIQIREGRIDEVTDRLPREKESNNRFRKFVGKAVNDPRVQVFIIVLIILNAIMMGLATFDFVTESEEVNAAFEAVDEAFLIIFTIELVLQGVYHGFKLFENSWLVFDLFIVVLSWSLESFQIVRAFRVFRAVRLVARMEALQNLVTALFHVAPSMGAIVALLLLILYVFAVMCTELFRDTYVDGITSEDYFSRLDITLFTLFMMLTMEWADVVREIMEVYYWAWGIFGAFLVLTGFILYSLVIAVICDAVAVTEQDEVEARKEKERLENEAETRSRIHALQKRVTELSNAQLRTLNAVDGALKGIELPVKSSLRVIPPRKIRSGLTRRASVMTAARGMFSVREDLNVASFESVDTGNASCVAPTASEGS